MSDDWDTSGHAEQEGDPYNTFGSEGAAAAVPAAASELVTEKLGDLKVEEEAPQPAVCPPGPVPVAETEVEKTPVLPPAVATSPPRKPSTVPSDAPAFLKEAAQSPGGAFTERLSPEALQFFNELCDKSFNEQAVAFLNAYWQEVNTQAEFIFQIAYERIRYADMHVKGVNYVHLYNEGSLLEFTSGLYFYEKLCKLVLDDDEGAKWRDDPKFAPSMPEMMTAIKRKVELREKVDCNFDGKVSFLEYLLYQYRDFANPADFTFRAMKTEHLEEHPEILKARKALAEVTAAIQAYEAEKHRLETDAAKPGVKGLGAKHQLAILGASPLAEQLNKSLITAEAAVRMATRKFGNGLVPATGAGADGEAGMRRPTDGSVWWMNRDLEEKKKLYGRMKK